VNNIIRGTLLFALLCLTIRTQALYDFSLTVFGTPQFCHIAFLDSNGIIIDRHQLMAGEQYYPPEDAVDFLITYADPANPDLNWREQATIDPETPAYKVVCRPLEGPTGRRGGIMHLI